MLAAAYARLFGPAEEKGNHRPTRLIVNGSDNCFVIEKSPKIAPQAPQTEQQASTSLRLKK